MGEDLNVVVRLDGKQQVLSGLQEGFLKWIRGDQICQVSVSRTVCIPSLYVYGSVRETHHETNDGELVLLLTTSCYSSVSGGNSTIPMPTSLSSER